MLEDALRHFAHVEIQALLPGRKILERVRELLDQHDRRRQCPGAVLLPFVMPARIDMALERVGQQVYDDGRPEIVSASVEPAILIRVEELPRASPHAVERGFGEVEIFLSVRGAGPHQHWCLVIPVEMYLIGAAADLRSLQQLLLELRLALPAHDRWDPVLHCDDAVRN